MGPLRSPIGYPDELDPSLGPYVRSRPIKGVTLGFTDDIDRRR